MTRRTAIDYAQTALEAGGAIAINAAAWLASPEAGIAAAGLTAIAASYAITQRRSTTKRRSTR